MIKKLTEKNKDFIRRSITKSETYADAAVLLNVHNVTISRWAKKLDCRKLGLTRKNNPKLTYLLQDILDGKYPQYPTYLLKNRLVAEGLKDYKCEECGIIEWNSKSITIEMDHINGNRHDHSLTNLRMLCPNCHSQTDTYKSRNKGTYMITED